MSIHRERAAAMAAHIINVLAEREESGECKAVTYGRLLWLLESALEMTQSEVHERIFIPTDN